MLNNLTNLFNLIKSGMVKTVLEDGDLFVVGTQDSRYDGGYKPTIAPLNTVVQAVISELPPAPPSLYGLFAQTEDATAVTNTTDETTIIGNGVGTLSVPANSFQVGDSFHAKLIGKISCIGSAELQIRVKTISGVLLADTGVIALDASTDRNWEINVYFTVRELGAVGTASIVSGGIFSYIKNSGANFEGMNFSVVNDTTFDTTVSNELDVTVEWNAASTSNSIQTQLFVLSKIY
jgi:hypothetical protein